MIPTPIDPTDPWLRQAQTFPVLSAEMIERAKAYGREEIVADDGFVFERGQRAIDFFLVLEGEIELFIDDVRRGRRSVFTYHPGQFSGEQNIFTRRPMLLSGLAKSGSRLLRVANRDFHAFITGEPDIGETIIRAYILRRAGFVRHAEGGVLLMGNRHHADVLRIQRFLTRNLYPVAVVDPATEDGAAPLMQRFGAMSGDLPVVVTPDNKIWSRPSNAALADLLGISEPPEADVVYDVAVVGAGPAGLAASVYGASEGLNTIVLETLAPGGQAGTSSKIENYLGFPTGISGQALAGRAHIQAQKFGARISVSREVTKLDCSTHPYRLVLDDETELRARTVVIATGARYRKLDVLNYDKFEGQGIHYAATAMEAQVCAEENIIVVGGGNSAGQAAVFLSRTVKHVHMLMRSGIASTMSDYLVQRIESSPRISLYQQAEITALQGDKTLESVSWIDHGSGVTHALAVTSIFVMIGASPNTGWLDGCLDLDQHGFVKTGMMPAGDLPLSPYETSKEGIFAVGDVRAASVKRVASAVGEGSVVIAAIHQCLEQQRHADRERRAAVSSAAQ
ncbi:FAD-dependent oxidoreductase [Rhizobium sp. 18055]|uniref:FAD-dependent oxidoreductase n=1 Tax=Rhizobium sp. 18055 TaxID=2681403 RepID=UPI00135C0C17|nr:FAD-dependent oxidoreductase [Rhizobium sp. 18055]